MLKTTIAILGGLEKGQRRQQAAGSNQRAAAENSRLRGRVVRAPDLKSGDSEFKSHSDYQLGLFQVIPDSTPLLPLYIANWLASRCQLGFLTC